MSKRSVTEVQTATASDAHETKRPFGTQRRASDAENEMGEFEDAWEDEIESDEEVVDGEAEDGAYICVNVCRMSDPMY